METHGKIEVTQFTHDDGSHSLGLHILDAHVMLSTGCYPITGSYMTFDIFGFTPDEILSLGYAIAKIGLALPCKQEA